MNIYNPEEYNLDFKKFLYPLVLKYFTALNIKGIFYHELRQFMYDINSIYISEIIKQNNLQNIDLVKTLVKQFCIYQMIDSILVENTFYKTPTENFYITYNGFYAEVNNTRYNCYNFPDGFYLMPDVINKKVIERLYHVSQFPLADKFSQVRFTLVGDYSFGDLCPSIYRCVIDKVMGVLTENLVAFFQKRVCLIDRRPTFQIQGQLLNTEEMIMIITARTKISFINQGKSEFLELNPGSMIVLKRQALYTTFQIDCLENISKKGQNIIIFA
jgi:hypothetical protein